jgi:dihydrofolate synthase / folylpolyglutamate synthase
MTLTRAALSAPAGVTDYLGRLSGRSRSEQLQDPTPDRVAALLGVLGSPHLRYPAIHVSGTNGKGSAASMAASLLAREGLRVGLYTGPHLSHVNERITIAGRCVSDRDLQEAAGRVERASVETGITPGWFEALTVAALWLFAAKRVEAAVVEVGMLGRLDATNVLRARTAVITNVELDHEAEAGGGRAAIATEKAQIVYPGCTLILGEPDAALRPIFEARAPARILTRGRELATRNRRASLRGSVVDLENPWGLRPDVPIGMIGAHQCHNAILALSAAEAFLGRAIPARSVSPALSRTRVAGRFEIRHDAPLVVLDGAHNPAAAVALRRAVSEISVGKTPRVLVYGLRRGRDPAAFLRQCGVQHVDLIVVTEVERSSDIRSEDLAAATELGADVAVVRDPAEALDYAVRTAARGGLVVATGSLHLVGRLRGIAISGEGASSAASDMLARVNRRSQRQRPRARRAPVPHRAL